MSQPFLEVWSFPCYSYKTWFWLDIETLKEDRLHLLAICSWQFVPKVQRITAYPLSFLVGSFFRVTAFVWPALTLGVLSLLSDNRQTLSSVDSLNVYTYCWVPDNEAQKYLLVQKYFLFCFTFISINNFTITKSKLLNLASTVRPKQTCTLFSLVYQRNAPHPTEGAVS